MAVGKRKANVKPENVMNERRVLQNLRGLGKESLQAYSEGLAEKTEGSYERAMCAKEVESEKKALRAMIQMAELGLLLLGMGSKSTAIKHYEALPEKPIFAPYIENELLTIAW